MGCASSTDESTYDSRRRAVVPRRQVVDVRPMNSRRRSSDVQQDDPAQEAYQAWLDATLPIFEDMDRFRASGDSPSEVRIDSAWGTPVNVSEVKPQPTPFQWYDRMQAARAKARAAGMTTDPDQFPYTHDDLIADLSVFYTSCGNGTGGKPAAVRTWVDDVVRAAADTADAAFNAEPRTRRRVKFVNLPHAAGDDGGYDCGAHEVWMVLRDKLGEYGNVDHLVASHHQRVPAPAVGSVSPVLSSSSRSSRTSSPALASSVWLSRSNSSGSHSTVGSGGEPVTVSPSTVRCLHPRASAEPHVLPLTMKALRKHETIVAVTLAARSASP